MLFYLSGEEVKIGDTIVNKYLKLHSESKAYYFVITSIEKNYIKVYLKYDSNGKCNKCKNKKLPEFERSLVDYVLISGAQI